MLKKQLIDQTNHFVERARQLGYATPDHLDITFDIRGRVSGYAWRQGGDCGIRYNLDIAKENASVFLGRTVPHEVAHIVCYLNYPSRKVGRKRRNPHGEHWQRVMREFGVSPKRCHSYKTTPARVVAKKFLYRCGCRERMFTSIRHNRNKKHLLCYPDQDGLYRCNSCGKTCVFQG
jgi:SprT protein